MERLAMGAGIRSTIRREWAELLALAFCVTLHYLLFSRKFVTGAVIMSAALLGPAGFQLAARPRSSAARRAPPASPSAA